MAANCLHIAELQIQIVQFINDERTLAHLARVCKSFKDAALDALYAHIRSFPHFLTCLPSDLWRKNKGELVFTRPMTRSDWDVLHSYAARVITIRDAPEGYPPLRLASASCDALCMCPIPLLFPKLQSVEMTDSRRYLDEREHRLFASCFVSPQLRSLKLGVRSSATGLLLKYAPKLSTSCPRVQTIEIDENPVGADSTPTMSQWICALDDLRAVKVGPVDVNMLDHLRQLDSLRSLEIYAEDGSQWLASDRSVFLSHLENLTLHTDYESTAARAVERLLSPRSSGPMRKHASIRHLAYQATDTSSLAQFTTALERARPTGLSDLQISVSLPPRDTNSFPDYNHLRPLASFRDLKSLRIEYYPSRLDLCCSQIVEIAGSWPGIETLVIHPLVRPISLPALVELMHLLPSVRNLGVHTALTAAHLKALDGSEPREGADYGAVEARARAVPVSFKNVKTLRLSWDDRGDQALYCAWVAYCMHRLVPNLEDIEYQDGWTDFWSAVSLQVGTHRRDGLLYS
ncbi:hypothetical protein CONPUDRAFT_147028 [Coniophora puteana RWD-64-598 SS2]|uniref:F-box domain-containing protein n=1 Tax=Coniophora puteana (strain RWD-64-598) TaxID=741705 RepID=A0A5M3M9Q5_CONPW|nr:uncharacterized protein CONPUDRAFT_147028 [Coniophora puteana RWD-64-598 SS2]EIW75978.1 hypothetical protein CONPUDRAFT_147028 [Coniophora puteana RWD-64-598 SS2]